MSSMTPSIMPNQPGRIQRGQGLTPPAWSPKLAAAGESGGGPSLAAMYQGLNPNGVEDGPAGAVPADSRTPGRVPRAKPSAPPEVASGLNARSPGYFNGEPNNGTKGALQSPGSLPAPPAGGGGGSAMDWIGQPTGPGAKGRLAGSLGSTYGPAVTGGPSPMTGDARTQAVQQQAGAQEALATYGVAATDPTLAQSGVKAATVAQPAAAAASPAEQHYAPASAVDAGASTTQEVKSYKANNGGKSFAVDAPVPSWFATGTAKERQAWIDKHTVTTPPVAGGGSGGVGVVNPGDTGQSSNTVVGGSGTGDGKTGAGTGGAGAGTGSGGGAAAGDGQLISEESKELTSSSGQHFNITNWGSKADNKALEDLLKYDDISWWKTLGTGGFGLTEAQAKSIGINGLPDPGPASDKSTRWNTIVVKGDTFPQTTWDPWSPQGIQDPKVANLAWYASNLAAEIRQLSNDTGTSSQTGKIQEKYRQLGIATKALSRYNIIYSPFDLGQDAPSSRPKPGDPGYDPYGIETEYPSLGGDLLPEDLRQMLSLGDTTMKPQDRIAALEFAYNLHDKETANYDKQKGLDELARMKDNLTNDPNRLAAQGIADKLGDYNLTDAEYQMTRNKTAGDYSKGLSQIREGLSGAAGASGMDPSAYAGSYAESAIGNRQALADRLGQMTVDRGMERRNNQLTNLDVRRQLSGQYTGADSAASMALANMLRGASDLGKSPMEGLGDTAANLYGVQTQKDANGAAGDAAKSEQTGQMIGAGAAVLAALI